ALALANSPHPHSTLLAGDGCAPSEPAEQPPGHPATFSAVLLLLSHQTLALPPAQETSKEGGDLSQAPADSDQKKKTLPQEPQVVVAAIHVLPPACANCQPSGAVPPNSGDIALGAAVPGSSSPTIPGTTAATARSNNEDLPAIAPTTLA